MIPAGALVTVPLPVPVLVTVNGKPNVAETVLAAFIVTALVPVPEQAPPQPENVAPTAWVAVNVTTVPLL